MELDNTDDVATLNIKLIQTDKELDELIESLVTLGDEYNRTEVEVIKCERGTDEYREAKIREKIAEGRFKKTKALIRAKIHKINNLKILIKAEANTLGQI